MVTATQPRHTASTVAAEVITVNKIVLVVAHTKNMQIISKIRIITITLKMEATSVATMAASAT